MSAPTLKDLCLQEIASSADRFLAMQWSDGRFEVGPEHETDEWNFYHQQYILPAALLYTLDHPANPWCGNRDLWEAILRNGRHIVSRIAADGSMTWRLHGVVLDSPFVCQRLTCAWLLAYRMLRDRLPDEDKQLWQEAIVRASEWLLRRHILPHQEVRRFTSHDVGTGTNHFSLYLSLLYLAGIEFARAEWAEITSCLMCRLIADQRPGGYWEEHHGPALGYNYLTYHGVDQYITWSGDDTGLPALRAGLDLHQRWTYLDGIPVECIDGRMRHLSEPMLWGLAGFSRWPDGRGYARLLIESVRGKELSGESLARLAEAYLMMREGEEEPPPQARPRYRATLDSSSVVCKEGPWMIAISGQCSPKWPENQFCLDRQALLSVWREGVGLVLDGSNSKHQPELATCCRGSGREADALPLEARLLATAEGESVEVKYATFTASLRVRVVDAGTLDLSAAVRPPRGGDEVIVTLVPEVSLGETLLVEGRDSIRLGQEAFRVVVGDNTRVLRFGRTRMHLPAGAHIEYPISPFNSYSADNTSPPSANRVAVRCPVREGGVTCRLEAE